MAQYRIADPEELLQCPYDRTHKQSAKGFQYHLMKCRKNYKGKAFVSCPFNATHHMPRVELRHHVSTCPDKATIEPELMYAARKECGENNIHKGCTDTPVYRDLVIPTSEDWDSEVVNQASERPYVGSVRFLDKPKTKLATQSPTTSSAVGTKSAQPHLQPLEQPVSSVFQYSMGRGCGWGCGLANGEPSGRSMGRGQMTPPPGRPTV